MSLNKNVDKSAIDFIDFCDKNNTRAVAFVMNKNEEENGKFSKLYMSEKDGTGMVEASFGAVATIIEALSECSGLSSKRIIKELLKCCSAEHIKE